MRKITAALLVAALLTMTLTPPAWAGGDKAAVALGLGLLVGALVGVAAATPPPPYIATPGPVTVIYAPPPPRWTPGYWQDQWIPTATQLQVWTPAHHDAYGNWTRGHDHTQLIQSGNWTRVWMPGHSE